MQYENLSQNTSNLNQSTEFIDKLVNFKGFIIALMFFTLQALFMAWHLTNSFGRNFLFTSGNYWVNFLFPLSFIFILYFSISILSILLYITYFVGKESNNTAKEIMVLAIFKFLILGSIFVLVNLPFIVNYMKLFYYAKFGFNFNTYFYTQFTNPILIWLLIIWFSVFILNFISKILSKIFGGSKNKINKSENIFLTNKEKYTKPEIQLSESEQKTRKVVQIETQAEPIIEKVIPNEKEDNASIDLISQTQIEAIKASNIDKNSNVEKEKFNKVDTKSKSLKENFKEEVYEVNPSWLTEYLNKNFFTKRITEQLFLYFLLSLLAFYFLILLLNSSYRIVTETQGLIGFYIIFNLIVAFYYKSVMENYHNLTIKERRKRFALFFVLSFMFIGLNAIYISRLISTTLIYSIKGIIFLHILILIFIFILFYLYKNPNKVKSIKGYFFRLNEKYNKDFDPFSKFYYNKTIESIRTSPKSTSLIKKFILLNKDKIKDNLHMSTPLTFKDDIKVVFMNDYERLQKLLSYNGISTKSKTAVLEFVMETFSTFIINYEVTLQEYFTAELLKIENEYTSEIIVSNDFISSKFSKIFTQWESMYVKS